MKILPVADVDVLLPIRGPAPWLPETLQGLLKQTGINWRLVAVIHGDDKGISELIRSLAIPASIIAAPETGNLSDVLNLGLANTTAQFVARIDQDDIAAPHRLERQCLELSQDPKCAVIGSNAQLIDESGQIIGVRTLPASADEILKMMRWRSAVMHPTVTFRREAIVNLGGYSPVAANVEDYDLWLRVLQHMKIRSLPENLLQYRIHGNQMTQTKSISRIAARKIRDSRLDLARARNESTPAARFRQDVWSAKQAARRWKRE